MQRIDPSSVSHAVALYDDAIGAIRDLAPDGVNRIIEVSMSDNADLDVEVVANDAVIAAYATRQDRTEIPFWPMLFANVTLRLIGSDDFPVTAKRQAARDLTAAGALRVDLAQRFSLEQIAASHERVDSGGGGRVLVTIPR